MRILAFLGIFCFAVSCGQRADMNSATDMAMASEKQASYDAQTVRQTSESTVAIERKLIKTGNLTIQVDDVKEIRSQIDQIIKKQNGYVADERLDNYGDRLSVSLMIRVPAAQYDTLVAAIEQIAEKTENKSVNVQDVTEEYIDVEARLKTKRELETRYREILKQANTVTDMLSVESNLNNVRAEIESMEGRLKYLSNQVSFSTLNLNFYQKISSDFGFLGRFGEGLKNGWTNLLSFVIGLVNIWPFLLIIGVSVWGFLRWRKNRKAGV